MFKKMSVLSILIFQIIVFQTVTASEDACRDITFHTVEAMESQGAFGLETPDLYPDFTIGNSLQREIEISKYPELLTNIRIPLQSRQHPAWGKMVPSKHYWFGEAPMQHNQLCQIAKRKGISELSIVCKGDSHSSNNSISSECFISTQIGGEDLDDYREKMWGQVFNNSARISAQEGGRYQALSSVAIRQDLYGPMIRNAINQIVEIENRAPDSDDELYLAQNLEFLSELHGGDDIVISPELAQCMGKMPHDLFRKWAEWDKKRFPEQSFNTRKLQEVVENIIFFIIFVIPFL